MPSLLSGSRLRTGGSGQFIKLPDAMPQLPQSPSTSTGFTIITNDKLVTSYTSSLGNLQFDHGQVYSNLPGQSINLIGTDTRSVIISGGTTATNTNTGALVVEGGMGIWGGLYVGAEISATTSTFSTLKITGTFTSISTQTGALQVVGGAGIGENLNVGGKLGVLNTATFHESVNVFKDTNISGELNVTGLGSVNLTPAAASITLTPTLGGTITIRASTPGTMDAMIIGSNVPEDAYFQTIHALSSTVTNNSWVGGSVYSQDGISEYNNLLYTPKVTISATAPLNPRVGDFWIIPQYGAECQYVNDGGNLIWIQFTGF